jgi:hypothetical protein
MCGSQSAPDTPYVVPGGQNLVVTSVDIISTAAPRTAFLSLFLTPPPFSVGVWEVPGDGFTHSFQYPGGLVFPAGFKFASGNMDFDNGLPILQGFLTAN